MLVLGKMDMIIERLCHSVQSQASLPIRVGLLDCILLAVQLTISILIPLILIMNASSFKERQVHYTDSAWTGLNVWVKVTVAFLVFAIHAFMLMS